MGSGESGGHFGSLSPGGVPPEVGPREVTRTGKDEGGRFSSYRVFGNKDRGLDKRSTRTITFIRQIILYCVLLLYTTLFFLKRRKEFLGPTCETFSNHCPLSTFLTVTRSVSSLSDISYHDRPSHLPDKTFLRWELTKNSRSFKSEVKFIWFWSWVSSLILPNQIRSSGKYRVLPDTGPLPK